MKDRMSEAAVCQSRILFQDPLRVACPGHRTLRSRCSDAVPEREGRWFSDLRVLRSNPSFTSVRLEWTPERLFPRYNIVWRIAASSKDEPYNVTTRKPRVWLTVFIQISMALCSNIHACFQSKDRVVGLMLNGLQPGTTYEVMVCRTTFNLSAGFPPAGKDPFIPECGFCARCFTTETPFYVFKSTDVFRLNATYVNLTCGVESNIPRPQFSLNWMISDEEGRRRMLVNGGLVDGKVISIRVTRDYSLTSTLTAPDSVLEQDVRCTAVSSYKNQSSDSGAFIEGI